MADEGTTTAFNRRDFCKTAAAASVAAVFPGSLGVFARGSDAIKVGVIGCGGRGTGATLDCLNADPGVEVVALGDLVPDRVESALEKLKSKFVHTPVKTEECTGCHNPHTSAHGKLLAESPRAICLKCHEGIIPVKAVSSHKVALEGNCVACHDPHGSNNKGNLVKALRLAPVVDRLNEVLATIPTDF